MDKNLKRVRKINEEFSTYEIPDDPKKIIEYLLVGDKNGTENFAILREFVLSQLHVDLHFDHIINEYTGKERANRINFFTGNHNFPIIGDNAQIDGKYIVSQMIEGNMDPYKDFVEFINKYYEPENVIDENPINSVLSREEIEGKRKQFLEWAKLDGKTEEDVDKEIQRITEKNERLAKVKELKHNKDSALTDLKSELDETLAKEKKIEELQSEILKLQEELEADIEKGNSLGDVFRSTYQFMNAKKMSEQDREKLLSRKPKNRFEKNIRDKYIQDKIADKKEELESFSIDEEKVKRSISEKLQIAKSNCMSKLGKREIDVLLDLESEDFAEQIKNLRDGIETILVVEDINQTRPGEYGFCYNYLFEPIEYMAKDIKANLELGKEIYSDKLIDEPDFEKICYMIREKMAKVGADTEIDPDNKENSVGIETGYRKNAYTINQQNKTPFVKGGKYGHKEISEKMQELGKRFEDLQKCEDIDKYVRESSDFVRDFIALHPYTDGNGRTSRMLLDVMMAKKGIVIPSVIESYYERYSNSDYSKAEEMATAGDYKPMQEYLIKRVRKFNPDIPLKSNININTITKYGLQQGVTITDVEKAELGRQEKNIKDPNRKMEGVDLGE